MSSPDNIMRSNFVLQAPNAALDSAVVIPALLSLGTLGVNQDLSALVASSAAVVSPILLKHPTTGAVRYGLSTYLSAIENLPLVAGDMLYIGSSGAMTRLAAGSPGNFLAINSSSLPNWATGIGAPVGAGYVVTTADTSGILTNDFNLATLGTSGLLKINYTNVSGITKGTPALASGGTDYYGPGLPLYLNANLSNNNLFIGDSGIGSNFSGTSNTSMGVQSAQGTNSNGLSTTFGFQCGQNNTGPRLVAFGPAAGQNNVGDLNIFIGLQTGQASGGAGTGTGGTNIGIGAQTLQAFSSGENSVVIGHFSCNTIQSYNAITVVGHNSQISNNLTGVTTVGSLISATHDYAVVCGASSASSGASSTILGSQCNDNGHANSIVIGNTCGAQVDYECVLGNGHAIRINAMNSSATLPSNTGGASYLHQDTNDGLFIYNNTADQTGRIVTYSAFNGGRVSIAIGQLAAAIVSPGIINDQSSVLAVPYMSFGGGFTGGWYISDKSFSPGRCQINLSQTQSEIVTFDYIVLNQL